MHGTAGGGTFVQIAFGGLRLKFGYAFVCFDMGRHISMRYGSWIASVGCW